jgi:TAT (twin-arginine translocation) pathway signal sequence
MEKSELHEQEAMIHRRDVLKLGAAAGAMIALDAHRISAQNATGNPFSIDLHTHWVPQQYHN